ncbi:hypothetical protein NMS32_004314 [Vibrio alginolyticus]|nr:hypothetical protein [Vibrio alginolyticus]
MLKNSLTVKYEMSAMPSVDGVEGCISIMTAKLVDSETESTVASCEIYFADFLNAMSITDCHDLLDVDGVTYEFVGLFKSDFELTYELAEKLDYFLPVNRLVVIHSLKVPKEHRGNKLSQMLIEDIERRFVQDTDLLALKAFPFENRTPETIEGLARYYESINFKRTGVNNILIRSEYLNG